MAATVHLELGNGPLVVLLHGVGLGPGSFGPLAELLGADHRVVVVERPSGGAVEAQADAVAHLLRSLGAPGWVVGVSGGATVGLALAVRQPDAATSFVLHEPLVGPLAPTLHERFGLLAVEAARGEAEALEVVRRVMSDETWEALRPADRQETLRGAARWRLEVGAFAAFEPTELQLRRATSVPLLATIGSRSDPARRSAASVLHDLAGAEVAVVAGAGNAAHVDAPEALVDLLAAWAPLPIGGSA